jgi:hypothetical protein
MNKRKLILPVVFLFMFFSSCTWFSSEKPCHKIIKKQTMVKILTDVFLLESQFSQYQSPTGIMDSIPYFYAAVFAKYDITSQQFDEAFECYMLDKENMTLLMDDVLSSISIIQSRMDEKKADKE